MIICALTLLGNPAHSNELAATPNRLEYQIKATLIYNFAKFVDWPTTAFQNEASPLVVGIVGSDPFGKIMEEVFEGKTVHGRAIKINRHAFSDLNNLMTNHLIFISNSEAGRIKEVITEIKSASILSISDIPGFQKDGGMIELFSYDNKLHFTINSQAADFAHIKINSQLLKMSQSKKDVQVN